ncbi:MAG: fluoride efflux transporter CrcB [Carboxydocellales bacterium]
MEYLYVGFGGVFGAISRYGLSKWVAKKWRGDFPLATFGINITGSLLLGILFILFSKSDPNLVLAQDFATTGLLGAFTTFSTFSYEIIGLLQNGEKSTAVAYFLASISLGLLAAYLGVSLGEAIIH